VLSKLQLPVAFCFPLQFLSTSTLLPPTLFIVLISLLLAFSIAQGVLILASISELQLSLVSSAQLLFTHLS
jgi:hypothetical protein